MLYADLLSVLQAGDKGEAMKVLDNPLQLSAQGQQTFDESLKRHQFPTGRVLLEKGDNVSGVYFVLQGQLRVYTYSAMGKEATLYMINPGETCVLALNSMFNHILYPAWVETEAETVLGVLPGDVYRSLFKHETGIQDLTVKALSTAVFRLMDELVQVHGQRLDQRLAGFLLTRASADGVVLKTQQQIAAHIGTTREVVAKHLAEFSKQGWVLTQRGQVKLCDTKALAALFEPMS